MASSSSSAASPPSPSASGSPSSAGAPGARFSVARLSDLPPVPCPCGVARRAFGETDDAPASVHLVEISRDSKVHFHRRMTEHYVVLEGRGHIELDGAVFPLEPLDSVQIRPGCRHRAWPEEGGRLRLLNVVVPAFDPEDECFD